MTTIVEVRGAALQMEDDFELLTFQTEDNEVNDEYGEV